MALILIDPCDDTTSWTPNGVTVTSISPIRSGTRCFHLGLGDVTFDIPPAEQTATITLGVGMYPHGTMPGLVPLIAFKSDYGTTTHLTLAVTPGGGIQLHRGTTAGVVLGTSTSPVFPVATWRYVEFQAILSATGAFLVKVNGVTHLANTNVYTNNAGTKNVFDQIQILGGSTSFNGRIDDVWITNDTTFHGQCEVLSLYPTGDGVTNQWFGSDGDQIVNWQLVDEVHPNPADYVASNTLGARDLYDMPPLPSTTGSVLAVAHHAYVHRSDALSRQIKLLNRGGAGTVSSSPVHELGPIPTDVRWILAADPDSGSAWSTASVNALQTGVEVGVGGTGTGTVPAAPTLTAATPGDGLVTLNWTAGAADPAITDYVIERSPNGTTGWTIVAESVSTATSYAVTGLTNGTIQYFRVAAVNAVGQGVYSNVMSATPTAPPIDCTAVLTEPFNNFTANGWATSGGPTIVAGRTGTAAQFGGGAAAAGYTITSGSRSDYVTVGFAWKVTAAMPSSARIVELMSDGGATQHGHLDAFTGGSIGLYHGGSGTVICGSAGGVITANTWHYIEFQYRLHDTLGSAAIRVDGVQVASATNIDTRNGGTVAVIETLNLRYSDFGYVSHFDDLYLSTGAACTFQGDPNPPAGAGLGIAPLGTTPLGS